METPVATTRERRKRVHSTKCPCCSHEHGKPELKTRQSRKRKGDELKTEETPVLKTKRSSKSAKSKEVATLQSTDPDLRDEHSAAEGRVLRSGRSTPIPMEKISGKEKSVSQKPVLRRKPKVKKAIKQEGVRKLFKEEGSTDGEGVKSDLSVIKKEDDSDVLIEKNVSTLTNKGKAKAKTKKQQSKRSAKAQGNNQQHGGKVTKPKNAPKTGNEKVNPCKVTKSKHTQVVKTKGFNMPNIPKKTSAIEKLKIRAFDQLKEKLEIAFDRNSMSVPECVKLLQQITSPNLSEIFYSQTASVDDASSDSLVLGPAGKRLPEKMTEGLENTEENAATKENPVAENLSKAAQALVSFKGRSVSQSSYEQFGSQNENNVGLDQQFGKNNMDNQFDGATLVPRQTVNNLSSMSAFTQAKPIPLSSTAQSASGLQCTLSQVLQTSNLQAVNHGPISSDLFVKSNITESSTTGMSSSSPLVAMTSQFQQTANPLVSTTNQFLDMTKSTIPTTNQMLSTVNQIISTVNDSPLSANPVIPTAKQLLQTNPIPSATNPLMRTTNQLLSGYPNASANQTTSGSKTDNTLVAISPNLLVNQPQLALQFLQSQGTTSVITTSQTQPTPQMMCHNTTPNQQQTTLVTSPLNQRLLLPQITPPIDQKTLGSNLPTLLPGIKKPHDLLLPKVVTTAPPRVTGTLPTTSGNEVSNLCKLRPILPREPLVSPTFTIFKPLQGLPRSAKPNDTGNNVKQAVKRLVNGRTKNTDHTSLQQTTSLPDIASTFNKAFFTASSQKNVGQIIAPAQNNTEMANKEQAIKALLSIGSEQQTARQGKQGNTNVSTSKETEAKGPDDLLVVFDTDKGIFKVDDVTIDPQVNTIGKESYTCGKCGKIFTSLSYLARHIKRVCPDMTHRKWKCNHCDKAFRHPFGLQQHVFTHTGERPHKCSQCPKAFYSSNDLRRHSRIHSGERPYKCKHCGKTFATTISLKTHTFIHTGEKPHRCPHCPKTFATSSKLGRHIVTHSEQRPFACSQCPKTFNRSGDLRRHNLNLHQKKVSVASVTENPDSKSPLEAPEKKIENEIPS